MQTSSKVSYDNWSDWNLGNQIMNIRPVGTYCFCHHHHCHHGHHHCDCDCVDCEFSDSYIKPECDHHCHHHPHPPVLHPYNCHEPHLFPMDQDGDGFVESDMIHKHSEPYIPEPLPDEIGNKEDKYTTSTMEVGEEDDDITDNSENYYGSNLVVSVPKEIQPVETSDEIDSILDEDTTDDVVTTDEDGYHTLTDEVPTEEDNWETSKMIDTDTQEIVEETPVPEQELKEVEEIPSVEVVEEKPTRGRRRVNRGGRRKKEE